MVVHNVWVLLHTDLQSDSSTLDTFPWKVSGPFTSWSFSSRNKKLSVVCCPHDVWFCYTALLASSGSAGLVYCSSILSVWPPVMVSYPELSSSCHLIVSFVFTVGLSRPASHHWSICSQHSSPSQRATGLALQKKKGPVRPRAAGSVFRLSQSENPQCSHDLEGLLSTQTGTFVGREKKKPTLGLMLEVPPTVPGESFCLGHKTADSLLIAFLKSQSVFYADVLYFCRYKRVFILLELHSPHWVFLICVFLTLSHRMKHSDEGKVVNVKSV